MINASLPLQEPFLVFGAPCLGDAEIDEVVATLRSGWLGTGPRVAQFETNFRTYKGAGTAVAVNSGTAALHLAAVAAGLKPGDEVIVPAVTFCATVNAMVHAGATPVLADVDPCTMNLDPADVARRITPRTRALVPVHFAGRPCDMASLRQLADRHGLVIIEDCAHAVETEYQGCPAGTLGDFGCFSFYVTKNITTGEGGMVLARRPEDAARIKTLSLHGLSRDAWNRFSDKGYRHYAVVDCGFKYNMTDLQAALGIHQLARLEEHWNRRQQIWRRYMENFRSLPLELPAPFEPGTRHALHLFTLLVDETQTGIARDEFLERMTAQGIGVGVHYLSLAEHPYYQERFGWRPEDYPSALTTGRQTVSLPISARLTDADVARVIRAVAHALDVHPVRRQTYEMIA